MYIFTALTPSVQQLSHVTLYQWITVASVFLPSMKHNIFVQMFQIKNLPGMEVEHSLVLWISWIHMYVMVQTFAIVDVYLYWKNYLLISW